MSKAGPRVITVDNDRGECRDADFASIQEAINAANSGDTICVYAGVYYENLVINKTLSLIGQGPRLTIIRNRLNATSPAIYVTANNTVIRGFCVAEETYVSELKEAAPPRMIGIYISNAHCNEISYNIFVNNHIGICLNSSNNNVIHHNNFLGNTIQAYTYNSFGNMWDGGYPSGGNYWSDHVVVELIPELFGGGKRYGGPGGIDLHGGPYQNETGSDGISDVPYTINADNKDRYPLMDLVNLFIDGWLEVPGWINIVSNSTISDFCLNLNETFIRFKVSGEGGTTGYCRVVLPKRILRTENNQWTVLIDGEPVDPRVAEDVNNTCLYFTYNHSVRTVEIRAVRVVQEPIDEENPPTPTPPTQTPTPEPLPITWIAAIVIIAISIVITLGVLIYRKRLMSNKSP
ncbi:MAG: NosD domain-containing protein [Candidatus Bathyarchaeia archaeon]